MSMSENKGFLDYYSIDRTAKTVKTRNEGSKDSEGIHNYVSMCYYSYVAM